MHFFSICNMDAFINLLQKVEYAFNTYLFTRQHDPTSLFLATPLEILQSTHFPVFWNCILWNATIWHIQKCQMRKVFLEATAFKECEIRTHCLLWREVLKVFFVILLVLVFSPRHTLKSLFKNMSEQMCSELVVLVIVFHWSFTNFFDLR